MEGNFLLWRAAILSHSDCVWVVMTKSLSKRSVGLLLGVFMCAAGSLFSQQTPEPDEVRVRTSVYWPRSQFTVRVNTQLVEVGVVVRDVRSHTVGGLSRNDFEIEFALKEGSFNRMAESGLDASFTLQASPGSYRLRGVVQDGIDGKVVASTRLVEIR
jgi:hypothetical protein